MTAVGSQNKPEEAGTKCAKMSHLPERPEADELAGLDLATPTPVITVGSVAFTAEEARWSRVKHECGWSLERIARALKGAESWQVAELIEVSS